MEVNNLITNKLETHIDRMMCECGGEFKTDSTTLFRATANKIPHKCNKCGKEEIFDRIYPYKREVEVPIK